MHIPRNIRKSLESSLPSHVLEFLTEKFIEAEKDCETLKEVKKENDWLHQQLHQVTTFALQKQTQPLGYITHIPKQSGYQVTNRYRPWEWEEDFEVPEYRRGRSGSLSEFSMRRGGNRSMYNEGQGGSSSGGGGTSSAYVPELEKTERVIPPMQEPNIFPLNPEIPPEVF